MTSPIDMNDQSVTWMLPICLLYYVTILQCMLIIVFHFSHLSSYSQQNKPFQGSLVVVINQ